MQSRSLTQLPQKLDVAEEEKEKLIDVDVTGIRFLEYSTGALQPSKELLGDNTTHDQFWNEDCDPQNILWEGMGGNRDRTRLSRLFRYENYRCNPEDDPRQLKYQCYDVFKHELSIPLRERTPKFYKFHYNDRNIRPHFCHFQLRHNICCTDKNYVYFPERNYLMHYHVETGEKRKVFSIESLQMSCFSVLNEFILCGGLQGELALFNTDGDRCFRKSIARHQESITNFTKLFVPNGLARDQIKMLICNNDNKVMISELHDTDNQSTFTFSEPINHATFSPDQSQLVIFGDSETAQVIDANSGEVIHRLHGHKDFGFVTDWHPNGHIIATGNQDQTTKLWDVRAIKPENGYLESLDSCMGATHCANFTSDGKFLVVAECADFMHIYDYASNFQSKQLFDCFGEISGIALSPDDDAIFLGITDSTLGGLMQFKRSGEFRNSALEDALF